ncbi:MAG TPA: SLC13 family permease [Polyangiaceae bacterium LLY-WYZ-15_(1-7)]|nr:SLC13 family permease [Myxococcales bacterium]MAT27204.1 SLC13 family permease [Sandaracinus sp.]HJK92938.1 SLC13 family permease [Polyangiaceae bacterium LLY-WYZ-15_(1-7)]MBJ74924.1 SLC13 family permease [Sandaracinus sp.]HJK99936.1 SLC13 family permease [Polyangiaceae bacterium LLY-WYZ-15_(1-7)]
MSANGWITVGVVVAMVAAMALSLAGPDMVLAAGLTLLVATGVLGPDEAFQGFANPAVVTIGALFVVAAGVRETGALDYVGRRVLGTPRNVPGAQLRVMLPVGALSAFLNNTPVVAMFVPLLQRWAKQTGLRASLLLMPLSYAAILGGTCTLIGTSTNLVVAGMAQARDPSLDFGVFETSPLGLPALVVGVLWVLFASRRVLRDRTGVDTSSQASRQYLIALRVEKGSPVIGQTIEASGLRRLPGLYLVELERDGQVFPAVPPSARLQEGDVLRFTGVVETAVDLRKLRLLPETDQVDKLEGRPERRWVEAVVAAQSSLVGRSVREGGFRTKYNAAIIAVHRQGEHVEGRVGDIVLAPGDVLLLETHPTFARKHRGDPAFALVSEIEGSAPPRHEKAGLASLILLTMVGVNAAGLVPLVTASLVAAGAMLLCRCLSGAEARGSLDVRVLLTVGSALGVGLAMERSGAAQLIGEAVVALVEPYGRVVFLAGIYAVTALLAGAVYTATSAALMFPVAASAAAEQGLPLMPVALLVMIAASTAFSTPVGYAANLMVYGPGGYRYADFLRLGLPLQALVGTSTVIVLETFYF